MIPGGALPAARVSAGSGALKSGGGAAVSVRQPAHIFIHIFCDLL